MCFVNIYIQYSLTNTDFGVLQKSSKRFLISIFFMKGSEWVNGICEQVVKYFLILRLNIYTEFADFIHIFSWVRNPIKALFSVLDHYNMLKLTNIHFK